MRARTWAFLLSAVVTSTGVLAGPSPERSRQAETMLESALTYLRAQQDKESGGWSVPPKGKGIPNLPAITGLVLTGMLMQPGITSTDPAVQGGVKYILAFAHEDGGIYDAMLPSYNTAICLSALAKVDTPEAKARLKPGQEFLKNQQWGSETPVGMKTPGRFGTEAPGAVNASHPYFGGVGYGNHGRPDISNLTFAIQAWHDTGMAPDDPAMKRAVAFLERCQMLGKDPSGKVVNDQPYAQGSTQGGFIYAPGKDEKTAGQGESNAGMLEESLDDGSRVSRLRCYGSVTYAGFKSYLYAGLPSDDPRVKAVMGWVQKNYTLAENPGLGTDGYYYFLVMMGRAMDAARIDTVTVERFAPYRGVVWIADLPEGVKESDLKAHPALKDAQGIVVWAGPPIKPLRSFGFAYFGAEDKAKAVTQALDGAEFMGRKLIASMTNNPAVPQDRNWRDDLIEQLSRLQNADGSFRSLDDRWMENNPTLITAYSVIALHHALRGGESPAGKP